jgi:hypothetical protein
MDCYPWALGGNDLYADVGGLELNAVWPYNDRSVGEPGGAGVAR